MKKPNKKSITLNHLADTVTKGFAKVEKNQESFARMIAEGFNDINERMATKNDIKTLSERLEKVEHGQLALKSNVNNYLELSERRYMELKQRDALLAKWIKIVAQKTKVPIDVSMLEKI